MSPAAEYATAAGATTVPRIHSALFGAVSASPEHAPRWTLRCVCILFASLALWSTLARLDIVALAHGRLVPQNSLKIVQPAAAGIVREIHVREGDAVVAGQVLVRLDATENTADRVAIERELGMQRLQLRRIDAELRDAAMEQQPGDDPAVFAQASAQQQAHHTAWRDAVSQQQAVLERVERELASGRELLRKLELTQPSYRRSVEAYEKLEARNLVGAIQAEQVRREAIENQQDLAAQRAAVLGLEASVQEATRKLAQTASAHRSELRTERVQVQSRVTQLEQESAKASFRQANLELRAPQAGTVKELATTTIGAVVQPGTVLVSLVPAGEPLVAEIAIDNKDIAFVRPGCAVRIKLAAYPFQRYGVLEGVVRTVIADSQVRASRNGEGLSPVEGDVESTLPFKATIALNEQSLGVNGASLPIVAGMQLTAEIVEGRRTVLEYLLSPVRRLTSEAGTER